MYHHQPTITSEQNLYQPVKVIHFIMFMAMAMQKATKALIDWHCTMYKTSLRCVLSYHNDYEETDHKFTTLFNLLIWMTKF